MKNMIYMQKISIGSALIIVGLVVNACSITRQQTATEYYQDSDAPSELLVSEVVDDTESFLPHIPLTADIFYKILVAEIAGYRGKLDITIAHYLDLARSTRDPRIIARAVEIAMHAENYVATEELAQLWLEIDASDFDAYKVLAIVAMQGGNIDQALEYLDVVFSQNKTKLSLPQKLWMTVSIFAGKDNKQHLKLVLQHLVAEYQQNAQILLAYAQILVQLSELTDARKVLEQLLVLQPEYDDAIISYAVVLNQLSEKDEALRWLEELLKRRKDDIDLHIFYARLLSDMQRFDESQQQFESLRATHPNDPNVLLSLGLLYLRENRLSDAKSCFLSLSDHQNYINDASYYIGRIAEEENDLSAALDWYRKLSSSSYYFETQMRMGLLLSKQGKLEEARTHLQNVPVQNNKQWYTSIKVEAEILSNAERYDEAMEIYNQALQDKEHDELFYARAMLAEKIGDLDRLEQDLLYLLKKDPTNSDVLNALGYMLADKTDRYDEAYKLVKQALEISPNDHHILDSMGWVLYRQGQLDEAIGFLNRALEQKHDPEVAAHLGEVLWVKGDKDAAHAIWNLGLEHSPSYEKLHEVINRFVQ